MLEHEAFRNLTVYAKVLYVYMRNHAGAFSDTTTYSTNTATRSTETTKPIMSAHMYRKARDELIEAGFICWVNKSLSKYSNHAPAEFEFIDEWHTGKQSKLF
jgi:broad specificity phosphatase PhoE